MILIGVYEIRNANLVIRRKMLSLTHGFTAGFTVGFTGLFRAGQPGQRGGAVVLQELSAGSQFSERPMENINRSGPSDARVQKVRDLMNAMDADGRIGAARAAATQAREELASRPKMDKEVEEEHRGEIEMAKRTTLTLTLPNPNPDRIEMSKRALRTLILTLTSTLTPTLALTEEEHRGEIDMTRCATE